MKKIKSHVDYETIFHTVPDLYLLMDTDLVIVDVSSAYLKATMVTRDQIVGKGVFEVFPDNPDDPHATGMANLKASLNNVLKLKIADTMAIQKYDIRRPMSEGGAFEERYWSPINIPILEKNKVKYILHRVEDVTEYIHLKTSKAEQSKLMKALQTRAGEMEIEIYERAQEIQETNHQLLKANQQLGKLDKLKTKFFANISHELRTPLTLILGPLQKNINDPKTPHYLLKDLQLIQENAKILLRHVNDLLDISKIEVGKINLEYVKTDLTSLIRHTANLFVPATEARALTLSINAPDHCFLEIDPHKIQRVLMNLISNAIKFTPVGGRISMTLKIEDAYAQFIIEDTGPGIPSEFQQKIFDRFFQVDESISRQHEGSGLGLAITKDFIELHHGTIKVGNSHTGGAQFLVELPLKAPKDAIVSQDEHSGFANKSNQQLIFELKPDRPRYISKAKNLSVDLPKVLIVEDNFEMNNYLFELLQDSYTVERAYNGEEGLQTAIEMHPDLIITDIMMPKMSGVELVHQIRNHMELVSTPIIILTAKADDKLCVQMLREGAQDCLVKPFSAEELKARVSNLIITKKMEDELERFIYLASHDLKSPLPAMHHLISWIEEDLGESITKESKKHFDLLRKRTARMAALLDGLIKYSQAGHVSMDLSKVNSKSLVQDIFQDLNPPDTFTFRYDKDLPTFKTAKAPLQQVFSALMDNSIKHHHQAYGQIDIGVQDMGNVYQFYVADDGPGIEPQYHQKIFQLFQTLKPRDVLESSGVGLSIAKKIIESLGCSIHIRSDRNKGTVFFFTWPKQL
jgi:signal transduction histidine kinase